MPGGHRLLLHCAAADVTRLACRNGQSMMRTSYRASLKMMDISRDATRRLAMAT